MISEKDQNKISSLEDFLFENKDLILLFIVVLSFILKFLFLKHYISPNYFDVQTYLEAVDFFLKDGSYSDVIMPLYPIIVYISELIINIQMLNILCSCITIIIIFNLLKFIYNKIIFKFITIIVIAFYPYNIFFSITGFSETIYVLFLCTTLIFFYKNKIFLATFFGSLALLIKPTHFFILLFLILYFEIYYYKKNYKKNFLNIFISFIILIFIMMPWWILNYNKYNQFIMFNLSAPLMLFAGNNPLNKSGGGIIIDENDISKFPKRFNKIHQDFSFELLKGYPGFTYDKSKKKVVFIDGVEASIDRSRSYLSYSKKYIFNNPDQFMEQVFRKFLRFWRPWPYSQEYNKPLYMVISILSFGPVLLLFIFYIAKYISKFEKQTFPLILMIFYFNAVHLILISSIRYRFPIENFVIILGIYFLLRHIGQKVKLR